MAETEIVKEYPDLLTWKPSDDQIYFVPDGQYVYARYKKFLGLDHDQFSKFAIIKNHYIDRMDDVVHHINYFINFLDDENEYFLAILSVKYLIDTNPNITQEAFKNLLIKRVITPSFVSKIRSMVNILYKIDIDTDRDEKFKTTPKITNIHAKAILALSFCFRMILPICIHFINITHDTNGKRDYIACFDKIFMDIISIFEKDDVEIYSVICRFVEYRVRRNFNQDISIWNMKKQIRGENQETYLQTLIHEVIIVKSIYKILYTMSIVSYFDGVIQQNYLHFKHENFKYKPFEIEADTGGTDNDDYLSHAESLEMAIYRIDESNILINEVNTKKVIEEITSRFNVDISQEEFDFYNENIKINTLLQKLLHAFYTRFFYDSTAIYSITREQTIRLLIIMKKYLQLKGMTVLPQLCTAHVRGKFKENMIKNNKFKEKYETSNVYKSIIQNKFKYIRALNPKDDPVIRILSTIINSSFILCDPNPELNGKVYDDIDVDRLIDEYFMLLSII